MVSFMKRFATWTLVWITIIGMGVAVFWPVETWRLYDKNWQPLAMTQAENWCTGVQIGTGNFENKLNDPSVADCVADSKLDNEKPSITNSQIWFCQGINSIIADFTVDACVKTVRDYKIWGLLHGGFTFEWADSGNTYPEIAYDNIKQAPPRGERDQLTDRSFG